MKGHLVIHVSGYKMVSSNTIVVFGNGHALPDRLVPAIRYEPGTSLWFETGWAVGDNPRDRFCKWGDPRKMRQFSDYDEAVSYAFRLRQKRKAKNEEYRLVYVLDGQATRHYLVSSMDQINVIDRQIDELDRERKARIDHERPEYGKLMGIYNRATAFALSQMLGILRSEGMARAAHGMSKSTFYRRLGQLRDAGVLDK